MRGCQASNRTECRVVSPECSVVDNWVSDRGVRSFAILVFVPFGLPQIPDLTSSYDTAILVKAEEIWNLNPRPEPRLVRPRPPTALAGKLISQYRANRSPLLTIQNTRKSTEKPARLRQIERALLLVLDALS